jgi:hypothetical protein
MRAKKVDTNQPELTEKLRKLGFSVFITSDLGKGYPDINVGWKGLNFLIEIKPDDKARLTKREQNFFDTWQGQVDKCVNVDDVIEAITDSLIKLNENMELMFYWLEDLRDGVEGE